MLAATRALSASWGLRRASCTRSGCSFGFRQDIACNSAVSHGFFSWVHQDVVILGTGAFALEAMEAAHRARARSITLMTRPRDRSQTKYQPCGMWPWQHYMTSPWRASICPFTYADLVCRWIMPYSQQFKFVFLATCPFCPRWLACWAVNSWMAGLYKSCGIAFMGPAPGSDHSFTGQCNDAFFQLAKKVRASVLLL